MYFESAGTLVRMDLGEWLDSCLQAQVFFDRVSITDARVHYIQKSIIREACMFAKVDEENIWVFLVITTDRDPNEGRFQTIEFRGNIASVKNIERAFRMAMA